MLGRVMSVDYALYTLFASILAFFAGALEDKTFLSPQNVCIILAVVAFLFFASWGIYFLSFDRANVFPEPEEVDKV
jgi:hypothetical protein